MCCLLLLGVVVVVLKSGVWCLVVGSWRLFMSVLSVFSYFFVGVVVVRCLLFGVCCSLFDVCCFLFLVFKNVVWSLYVGS